MEYSQDETPTPHFGSGKKEKFASKTLFEKKFPKSTKDVPQCIQCKEKSKNKSKSKEKSKRKEKSISKNKEKSKNKNKEKSKKKHNSSKSKKTTISSVSLPIEQKYENIFDVFLQKKLKLRGDFDQNNSENFLTEKELAFQQFQMNEDADYLDD